MPKSAEYKPLVATLTNQLAQLEALRRDAELNITVVGWLQ